MLLLAALFLVAAADQSATASAAPAANAPDPQKLICKNITQTGSRLSSNRMCMTRAEWDERQRQAQKDLRQMQGNMGPCPGKDQSACGGGG